MLHQRVMSASGARTYTTTVGSQTVELPLVPLSDELSIALLIAVDLGVAFSETAGRAGDRRLRRDHGDSDRH